MLISLAGGLAEYADKEHIQIVRIENGQQKQLLVQLQGFREGQARGAQAEHRAEDRRHGHRPVGLHAHANPLCFDRRVGAGRRCRALGRADAVGPRSERPYRGLFAGDTGNARQLLTLSASFGGGYDDDVFANQAGSSPPPGRRSLARAGARAISLARLSSATASRRRGWPSRHLAARAPGTIPVCGADGRPPQRERWRVIPGRETREPLTVAVRDLSAVLFLDVASARRHAG